MDVALNLSLDFAAGVDVVHIGIMDDLEHHLGVVGASSHFPVQFFGLMQIKTLDNGIDNAHRVVFSYIFIRIQQKKTACRCYYKILYVILYTFNLFYVIKLQKLL